MDQLSREKAIYKLCEFKLSVFPVENRESYILDWWGMDEDDSEFSLLSLDLQKEILSNEYPPASRSNDSKYDQLIMVGLAAEYKGVSNQYLEQNISEVGLGQCEVYGEIDELEVCPVCEYRTLSSRGNYEICPLCSWEDNGSNDLDGYNSPNQGTICEAKNDFLKKRGSLPLGKWEK